MAQGEGGGAPTKYNIKMNKQAYKLALLGATDKEMADFFEISVATFYNYLNQYPKFLDAIKKGKEDADATVAESLYKRANGYSHKDVDIRVVSDGQGMGSSIVETPIVKHYPPDTTAAIFWLKNRQRAKWRDKVETGFTDSEGNDVQPAVIYLPENGRNTNQANNPASAGLPREGTEQPG